MNANRIAWPLVLLACLTAAPEPAWAQIGGSGSGGSGAIVGGAGRHGPSRGPTATDGSAAPASGGFGGQGGGPGVPDGALGGTYRNSPTVPDLQQPVPSIGNTTGTAAGLHR